MYDTFLNCDLIGFGELNLGLYAHGTVSQGKQVLVDRETSSAQLGPHPGPDPGLPRVAVYPGELEGRVPVPSG